MRWHNSDWLQEQTSDHLVPGYEADENRRKVMAKCVICVVIIAAGIPFFYLINYVAFSVLLVFAAVYCVLEVLIRGVLLRRIV